MVRTVRANMHLRDDGKYKGKKTVNRVTRRCKATSVLLAAQRLNTIADEEGWARPNPDVGTVPLGRKGRKQKQDAFLFIISVHHFRSKR